MIPFKEQKLAGNLTCKEVQKMQHLREFSIASKSHKGHRSAYFDMINWISDSGNNSHTLHTLKFLIRKKKAKKIIEEVRSKNLQKNYPDFTEGLYSNSIEYPNAYAESGKHTYESDSIIESYDRMCNQVSI